MDYADVASCYNRLEGISSRNEITSVLASLLKASPKSELRMLVYLTQGKLRPDYEGVELGLAEKLALRALSLASGAAPEKVRRAYIRHGDVGAAAEELLGGRRQGTLFSETLSLERVYTTLLRIATTSGEGSVDLKLKELASLLGDASPVEAKFIMRTVTGELRLGVADYTVLDAASLAFLGGKEGRERIERAYNLHPDLGFMVQGVAERGLKSVDMVKAQVGVPIRPMLAERLSSPEAILKKLGGRSVAAEYKLDGERLQVHKSGGKVTLFSRRLEVVTGHYPDAVALALKHIGAKEAILEAEVVAVNEDTGEYLPFQELMHRRRKHGVKEAMERYPVALNFFELLLAGSTEYATKPYSVRRRALEKLVEASPRTRVVPSLVTSDPSEVARFMEEAISEGCEGLVVKDLESVYRAGAREFAWIKLKREYRSELTDTIDLVVVGAFHGKGRRTGAYGTFLLSAYDPDTGTYPTMAKVGTGFTDEDLGSIPKRLAKYRAAAKPPGVDSGMEPDAWFRPGLVIEVIAAELTLSPIHRAAMGRVRPGAGLSLRFPKFTGNVREDKGPTDATTVGEVLGMYNRQLKKVRALA